MSLSIHSLSFSYDGHRLVLDALDLSVPTTNLLAVVGPSGCGKSTLLRLIAGLLPKARHHVVKGTVLLAGKPVSAGHLQPGQVSFMFQEPVLLPHRTVEQNIALPLEMLERTSCEIEEVVEKLIDAVGLLRFRSFRPSQLSVGMKSRVALAMTFSTSPSYLLLDEPFSSLDFAWRLNLYRTLGSLRQRLRPTSVIVTHDLREAILLADKIAVLSYKGELLRTVELTARKPAEFSPDELADYGNSTMEVYSSLERDLLKASMLEG